jgi:hypothetical protein
MSATLMEALVTTGTHCVVTAYEVQSTKAPLSRAGELLVMEREGTPATAITATTTAARDALLNYGHCNFAQPM